MSRSTISMALAAVGLCSLPAFVPGITGSRAPASSPTLRGTAEGSSTSTFGAAHAAGLALTVVGAAAVKRVSARKALRRELAVAYEDSGIDLLDNGKFAQGLVGGSCCIKWQDAVMMIHYDKLDLWHAQEAIKLQELLSLIRS